MPPAPLRITEVNTLLTGGGTDDRSIRIAGALRQAGNAVWLAGPPREEYSHVALQLGLNTHPLRTRGLRRWLLPLQIARLLNRENIQIIQARHGRDYWLTVGAARLARTRPKVILFRHLAKAPGSYLSRRFIPSQCDVMAAVSEFVAKVLREGDYDPKSPEPERHARRPMLAGLEKIRVVYGGFDMTCFRPKEAPAMRHEWGLKPDDYAFAVVGGYGKPRGKGQREFLKAAAQVHHEIPQARFLIVGRGDLGPTLEEDIRALGLKGKAWLTPYCQNMPAAMNAINCLVHPQIGTEAIPGVVIEAHACGRPVITTELDGNAEAFKPGNYGQIIAPESVEELAAAMKHWAGIPPLKLPDRELIHKKVADKFSLESAAQRLMSLYDELLGPRHGPAC